MEIHPSAVVSPKAEIGAGVKIGPYSVIGDQTIIGQNTVIGPHVVIDNWTQIGEGCNIFQFTSIGAAPQDLKYQGEESWVIIGNNNTIRESVTINRRTTTGLLMGRQKDDT